MIQIINIVNDLKLTFASGHLKYRHKLAFQLAVTDSAHAVLAPPLHHIKPPLQSCCIFVFFQQSL